MEAIKFDGRDVPRIYLLLCKTDSLTLTDALHKIFSSAYLVNGREIKRSVAKTVSASKKDEEYTMC